MGRPDRLSLGEDIRAAEKFAREKYMIQSPTARYRNRRTLSKVVVAGGSVEGGAAAALACIPLRTPAFVYDEAAVRRAIACARDLCADQGHHVLYSLKACCIHELLMLIAEEVSGFAASSLFEARLAREVLGDQRGLHFTAPGLTDEDVGPIGEIVDYLTFNSLEQLERFAGRVGRTVKCGLRVNPQLSFVADDRYNPCRPHSKLGVPLQSAARALRDDRLQGTVTGIHLHTNCESCDLSELLLTVQRIDQVLGDTLGHLEWINLGGGYLFGQATNKEAIVAAVEMLRGRYGLDVFVEPGAAIVGDAGYLISSVVDLFESDGKEVAILDTTVSHVPEVFEFQYQPDVLGAVKGGRYQCILAGCSCLAGDVFGEYAFDEPLEIGSRVVFTEMGAYTVVKAQMFNGINLPSVHLLSAEGELSLLRESAYEDFVRQCGVETSVIV